jgi:hypothetical protein
MSLYLNLENLQGPIHIALNLSNDFLILWFPTISILGVEWIINEGTFSMIFSIKFHICVGVHHNLHH